MTNGVQAKRTEEQFLDRKEEAFRQRAQLRNREETRICRRLAPVIGVLAPRMDSPPDEGFSNGAFSAVSGILGFGFIWLTDLLDLALRPTAYTARQRDLVSSVFRSEQRRRRKTETDAASR